MATSGKQNTSSDSADRLRKLRGTKIASAAQATAARFPHKNPQAAFCVVAQAARSINPALA